MCYTTLANRRKEREERVELPWLTHQKKRHSPAVACLLRLAL